MRRLITAIMLTAGVACLLSSPALAFHKKIYTRCIASYPTNNNSHGYCGAPCPPPAFTFPCTWSYPSFKGPFAGCYNGRMLCTPGHVSPCDNRYSGCGFGSGLGYGRWTCVAGTVGLRRWGCGLFCRFRGSAACGYSCDGAYLSCESGCLDDNCANGNCQIADSSDASDDTSPADSYVPHDDASSSSENDMLPSTDSGAAAAPRTIRSFQSDERVIYDGPADKAPRSNLRPQPSISPDAPPAPPLPQLDSSTSVGRAPFRLASQTSTVNQGDGSREFARGLQAYRDNNMAVALEAFEGALALEANNPLFAYYRALAMFNLHGPESANDWLAQAVQLERSQPITNWGKQMERVQGRARLWVEKARVGAGIGATR